MTTITTPADGGGSSCDLATFSAMPLRDAFSIRQRVPVLLPVK